MTKKEIVKCLYDYATCVDHSCAECSAFQTVKFEVEEPHKVCELLNFLEYGELAKKEGEE